MTAARPPGIFLITGPSGAGKSTIARLLAIRSPRGVHVEGDLFRRSIVAGRLDMTPEPTAEALAQLRLRYRLGAMVADAYFEDGFTVALEDVVAGPLLPDCVAMIRGRPLHVIVLMPSIESIAVRDRTRTTSGYTEMSLSQLYRTFLNETPRIGAWLDTSNQTPDETVEAILVRSGLSDWEP